MSIGIDIEKHLAMLAARDVAKDDPQMRSQDFATPSGIAIWNYGFVQGWIAAKRDLAQQEK